MEKHHRVIAVTGGSGRLGQYVVNELIAHHYQVRVLDLSPPPSHPQVSYKPCNVLNLDELNAGLKDVDGVIHLAALDFDFAASVPEEKFIEVNTLGTWNVLQTAENNGIKRVILCSSISACGLSEANPNFAPEYLPVDEEHPRYPIQPYSISKLIMEEMAESFVRRGNMAVLSLRPMMVLIPSNIDPTVERAWGFLPKYDADHYKNHPRASIFSGEKAKKLLGFEATSNWLDIIQTK